MEEKIEYKEVQDALYVLLHCSLKDKEYGTQKQQFDLVMNYIDRLQKENEELKNMQCEFLGTGCKREMKELQKNYIYYKNLANEYQGSCIPKSVIQDKIEKEIKYHEKNILDIENITMLKGKTAKEEAEIEFNKYAIVVLKKMLQELLESEE